MQHHQILRVSVHVRFLERVSVDYQQVGERAQFHGADVFRQAQCLSGGAGCGHEGFACGEPMADDPLGFWLSAEETSLPNAMLAPAARAAHRLSAPASMLRRASPASTGGIAKPGHLVVARQRRNRAVTMRRRIT